MNVLWITNVLHTEAKEILCGEADLKGSGGWVVSLADALSSDDQIVLHVATITPLVKSFEVVKGKSIIYYLIPQEKRNHVCNSGYERFYRFIFEMVHPDVVHIHGTEYPNSLAAIRACGANHTVVSLQGLVSAIAPHYLGGITCKEIRRNVTFHDIVRPNLFQQQKDMERRGAYELELLSEAKHIIGRTTWDRDHTWAVNPQACYYHCDELLRKEFYAHKIWNYSNCVHHSIFTGQGYYPLKGLHKLIEAISIVKHHYPDVQIRIAGRDITYRGSRSFINGIRRSSYGKIVKKMIQNNHLDDCVSFTGCLNAAEMRDEYLKSNVFVCPSCIENSPNSLAEAQVLGVPCIASYVGGIPDMMRGNEESMYRYEEVEMLAEKICRIFHQKDKIDTTEMRNKAMMRHEQKQVLDGLLCIYEKVKGSGV